jgi:putative ABC transport system ATP-binding protein
MAKPAQGSPLAGGERVALLGASGRGKSTLLNLLGTINTPHSGSIRIGTENVVGLAEPGRTLFRRRHLGFVYQRFLLVPTLTVAENVRLPLDLLQRGGPACAAGARGRWPGCTSGLLRVDFLAEPFD